MPGVLAMAVAQRRFGKREAKSIYAGDAIAEGCDQREDRVCHHGRDRAALPTAGRRVVVTGPPEVVKLMSIGEVGVLDGLVNR